MADAVVAIEAVPLRQLAQLPRGPEHALPQAQGAFVAKVVLDRPEIAGPARQRLPAVAPGRRPGDPAGLDHADLPTALRQLQRGVQAAEAGADDQHFAIQRPVERRARLQQLRVGGGVVSGNRLGGTQEHGGLVKIQFIFFMKINTLIFTRIVRQHESRGARSDRLPRVAMVI
ncbi:hypothetical protein D3C76_1098880 [compost metagenome]